MALADRELQRIENNITDYAPNTPNETYDDQIAVLKIIKDRMSRLNPQTLVEKVSQPALWHSDLHKGNFFVSDEDSPRIVSLIDWQSTTVSPLYLQVRFPEFLSIDENYELGTVMPKLPHDYDQMDAVDKEIADYKTNMSKLSKAYELSTGPKNKRAYKALQIPSFLRDLFIRCGEASEEGVIPLSACLIKVSEVWNELGFTGIYPYNFSEGIVRKHNH